MSTAELHGLHTAPWVCEQTTHEDCQYCGATPGHDCTCGPGAMHLARYARSVTAQRISTLDLGRLIPDSQPFSGATIVPDPEVTP